MPVAAWRAASCKRRPLELDYAATVLSSISLAFLVHYCEEIVDYWTQAAIDLESLNKEKTQKRCT